MNLGRKRLLRIAENNVNPLTLLLEKFTGAGDEVAIRCHTVTQTTRYIISQHLGNRKYWTMDLYAPDAFSVGGEWMSIEKLHIRTLYGGYNDSSTPSVTLSGLGWTTASNVAYPGGRLHYNATATRYAEFVTPTGITSVGGLANAAATNVGLAQVSIDGDSTLATSLPTAQSVVDSGAYSNTILVENGGTLNPNDRVWDQYNQTVNYPGPPNSNAQHYEIFATGLTSASHTVRLTVTGYKRAASTGTTVLFYVILAYGANIHNIASPTYEACLIPEIDIYDITSSFPRLEISYNTKPIGATNYQWIGHTGSLKYLVVPKVYVDGVEMTLVDKQTIVGSEIKVIEQLRVRHTEIGGGSTEVGILDLEYKMNKTTGLTITHALNWSMGGVAVGYPCMLTVEHATFDRFQSLHSGITATDLTANNDSLHFTTTDRAAYTWDYDGYVAALIHIPNITTSSENWSKSTDKLHWNDISANGGTWKKAYARRFQNDETFSDSTVWTSETNYRVQWFVDGANNHLN